MTEQKKTWDEIEKGIRGKYREAGLWTNEQILQLLRHALKQYEEAVRVERGLYPEKYDRELYEIRGFNNALNQVDAKQTEFWGKK
jgi:hypothetical protein